MFSLVELVHAMGRFRPGVGRPQSPGALRHRRRRIPRVRKKDVAVPFSTMQWKTEPRKVPATEQPPTNPVASTSGQTAEPPPMKETDPAATEASQGYPDKAILDVTLAQLKAAPDFQYAPSPVAESETRPAGGGETKKTTP